MKGSWTTKKASSEKRLETQMACSFPDITGKENCILEFPRFTTYAFGGPKVLGELKKHMLSISEASHKNRVREGGGLLICVNEQSETVRTPIV